MMADKGLIAIPLRRDELRARVAGIRPGLSRAEVERLLGGPAFKTERRGPRTVSLWRFRVTDAATRPHVYELYKAEFEGDRLFQGALLPHGA